MKYIIGGNWKANCDSNNFDTLGLFKPEQFVNIDVFIAVPSIFIARAQKDFPSYIKIGAQDISKYDQGPYTGEVTGQMLKVNNVRYVIIGHSERRINLGETSSDISKKLEKCLNSQLCAVLCIGESKECRDRGNYIEFLRTQLLESLGGLRNVNIDIAYEPIWAIGLSESAETDDINEVARNIKNWMKEYKLNGRILYGGSVTEFNVGNIMALDSVDGILVGNASLTCEFAAIAGKISKL